MHPVAGTVGESRRAPLRSPPAYPKRLIEVDLPIKRISTHARREKSIRHGHISTLHIWWARRPLAACRAVILAALWPDPADRNCPNRFRAAARARMLHWSRDCGGKASRESFARLVRIQKDERVLDDLTELQRCLLDFIADFANWDNSADADYLETSRALVQVAHESLGGAPGTRPLVIDPFAGGGSIPLEALRVGADAFASDLNPVAVLLNKVVLEYIPKYGQRLADEVRKWGEWIKTEAEKELGQFYPKDPDGANPIAYLWARTIQCEGPGCGAEVPLIRSKWLARRRSRSVGLRLISRPRKKEVDLEIVADASGKEFNEATVRRGSATCPVCGYSTEVARVRSQLRDRRGGANDARLLAVVTTKGAEPGRFYREARLSDAGTVATAVAALKERTAATRPGLSLVPDEAISLNEIRRINVPLYGMASWGDLFTARQALALSTFVKHLDGAATMVTAATKDEALARAVMTCLALAIAIGRRTRCPLS